MNSESRIFSISEVEEITGVATNTLRQWEEKFSGLAPTRRRGRRYYSSQDLDLIKWLKQKLISEGYTVKAVQELLVRKGDLPSANERLQALQNLRNHLLAALNTIQRTQK